MEPDAQVPDFLHDSRLGVERARKVVVVLRDVCARFEVGPNDGDQAVEKAWVSSGGVGGVTEVAEVQATKGEQGMDVDIAKETGTGEIATKVAVQGVEGPAGVKEAGLTVAKEVSGGGGEEATDEQKQEKQSKKKGSATKKQPTPSSPDCSTRSMTHKQDDSPTRNTRSGKRVIKPSRKRHGSDYA